ncbi:MAG: AAA family ATPase, partial [Halothiobacillaceae bacterium]
VTLALERYGHFDDCKLSFRSGEPDLHVIYGANEAGKTTSMAAVSDLLFGFPVRSPYNFIFDYSLLRVGAILEDDGRTMSCRRKKATSGTFLGPDDKPIDEGPLLAMLRGQTRETFGLSFSLDQEGLRAGGKAMVEARNDLGRALFAAGSGLTGVSDQLARLEDEADTIWGPRASNRRLFTVAQRELETSLRAIRERSLRPKAWLDCKGAVSTALAVLADAQRRRDELLAEISRAERIRRIAPSARLRTDHLAALARHSGTVDIPAQREDMAEAAMTDVALATRAKAAAAKLAEEATERMKALVADAEVLAQADLIDELVTASGAVMKADSDMVRLTTERATRAGRIERLREEAGALAADPPSRIAGAKLRELALAHVEDKSALSQIAESERELEERRPATSGTTPTGNVRSPDELKTVVVAVDAARALGADIDARCLTLRKSADSAAATLAQALVRLVPWTGDASSLIELPRIGQVQVDEVRTTLSELTTAVDREVATAARSRDEAAVLSLQMEQLASGKAVSADEIASARTERDERWRPLRDHLLAEARLDSPADSVTAFETTLAEADERSDLRFEAADESSRLTDMGHRAAKLLLDADQADIRAASLTGRLEAARTAWGEMLTAAGHADMEPTRFLSWNAEKIAAESTHDASVAAAEEADAAIARRA